MAQSYIQPDELDVALPSMDWQVLKNLRNAGDSRKAKREIDHFFTRGAPGGADQAALIEALRQIDGMRKLVKGRGRSVQAVVFADTTAQSIARQINAFEALARKHGYLYDGWGTSFVAE